VVVILAAGTPAAAAEGLSRRQKGDLAIRARAILKQHCAECHAGAEHQGTIEVLTYSRLIATGPNPVPFVAPEKVAASQVIQFLEEGSMPPGDRPRPTDEEIGTLKEWIQAGAPSYPAAFDDHTTLQTIVADLRQHPEEAAQLRYFSLAHLVQDGAAVPDLKKVEFDLQKALTWCGVKPPEGRPAAEPVDGTATLFRFDVQHAGWDDRTLFFRSPKGGKQDLARLTPYDLILLEYPFAARLEPADVLAKPFDDYFQTAGLGRRVPFIRADWLAEKLAIKAPLADDLRSLGELAAELKKRGSPELGKEEKMPCGPATRAFAAKNPVPPAPKTASVRPILPLAAWYTGDCQTEAAGFSVLAEAVDLQGKKLTTMVKGTPFRIKVKTDRKINYVLLSVYANGQVDIMRTKQGGFLEAGEHALTPEQAGAIRITDILTGEARATEYFVLLASTEAITPPTVVRSRHSNSPDCESDKRYPIYRFLPDDNALDSTKVVRKVIALTVTDN